MVKYLQIILDVSIFSLPVVLTFSRALVEIFLGLAIVSWVVLHILERKGPTFSFSNLTRPVVLPLFCFWGIGGLSLLGSRFLFKGLEEWLNMTEYVLLAWLVYERLNHSAKITLLGRVIVASSLVIAIDAIFQGIFGFDFLRFQRPIDVEGAVRLSASFSHPNSLGAYLAMVIPINFALMYQEKKWFYLVNLPVLFSVMILTYSRGAWMALVSTLFVFSLIKDKRLTALFLVLIFVLVFSLPDPLVHRMKDIFNLTNITTQMRFEQWMGAWTLFRESPWLGHGLKSFSLLSQKGYVHNGYLQILVEMGILGLASFLWAIGIFLIASLNSKRSSLHLGIGCAVLACVVHSVSDTILYSIPTATLFWLMFGLGQTELSSSSKDNTTSKKP